MPRLKTLPSEAPPPSDEPQAGAARPWSDWPIAELPLDEIVDAGHTHRLPLNAAAKGRLELLAASMKSDGLQSPILVYRNPAGKYARVFGSRRCAAAKSLGWEAIAARIMPYIPSAAQMHDLRAIENFHREDLSGAEKAIAAAELVEAHGLVDNQGQERAIQSAAEVLGVTGRWIRDCLWIVQRLTDKTRAWLAGGQLRLNQARVLAKAGDPEVQEAIAQQVVDALPAQDGGSHGGNYGGRIWSEQEIENVIANHQHSLRNCAWELGVEFKTPWGKDQRCDTCPNNSAVNEDLFETKKDEQGKGFCSHAGCYELRQKLVAKAQEKAVEKIKAQVKEKKIEKADAGGLEAARDAAPEFVKAASLQRLVRRELGMGETKPVKSGSNGHAGGTGKPKNETLKPEFAAAKKFHPAYEKWAGSAVEVILSAINANPMFKLAAIILERHDENETPEFNYPSDDYEFSSPRWKTFKGPIEEPVSPRMAKWLKAARAGTLEGVTSMLDGIDINDEFPNCLPIVMYRNGPEFMRRLADTFGAKLEDPPRFEDFLPKPHGQEKPAKGKAGAGGKCKVCGCTEDHACEGGCTWADAGKTICSKCVSVKPLKDKAILDFATLGIPAMDLDESGLSAGSIAEGNINRVIWAELTPYVMTARSMPEKYYVLHRLVPSDRWAGGEVIDPRKKKLTDRLMTRGEFGGVLVQAPYGACFVIADDTIRISNPEAGK